MRTPDLPRRGGELFRSDAKAEDGKASVGGWECKDGARTKEARWWYMEITKKDFEWAFAKENNPQRVIATLELLGPLLSIVLFIYRSSDMWASSCTIFADTDNQGVSLAMQKFMSTKWPPQVEANDIPWIVLPKVMGWSKEIHDHNNQLKSEKKERGFLPAHILRRGKLSAAKRLKTTDPW